MRFLREDVPVDFEVLIDASSLGEDVPVDFEVLIGIGSVCVFIEMNI